MDLGLFKHHTPSRTARCCRRGAPKQDAAQFAARLFHKQQQNHHQQKRQRQRWEAGPMQWQRGSGGADSGGAQHAPGAPGCQRRACDADRQQVSRKAFSACACIDCAAVLPGLQSLETRAMRGATVGLPTAATSLCSPATPATLGSLSSALPRRSRARCLSSACCHAWLPPRGGLTRS